MAIPNNINLPFVAVEFDNSRAFQGSQSLSYKVLLLGQKTSAGIAEALTVQSFRSADEARKLFGAGSMLHLMAKKFFKNNLVQQVFAIALEDAVGSSASTFTLTVDGDATANGEVALYVDGVRVAVGVKLGDAEGTVASAIKTALDKVAPEIGFTASVATNVVTLTAKNKGTIANGADIRFNYAQGETFPAGITVAKAVGLTGAVDPEVQDAIDKIGDSWFQLWVGAYTDNNNLNAIQTELLSRFGAMRQIDGYYITAKKATENDMIAFSTNASRNSQFVVCVDCEKYPNSISEIASAVAGQIADSGSIDPAVPLHRMKLVDILPPSISDRKSFLVRNELAGNGIFTLNSENGVQTEATVTMYLKNESGVEDISYRQLNTGLTLMLLRYRFVSRILSKYGRAKLANDNSNIRSGQIIITPSVGKAEAIAWFREAETEGLVEGFDQFKRDLVCQRSTSNPNRLEWILPPDLVNQFIVGVGQMQFLLESPST